MSIRNLVVSCVLVMASVAFVQPARADDPNRVFNGRIMVSNKPFRTTAKSPSAYIAQVRKQSTSNFVEDKTEHTWMVYFAAFLKSPLNDVEYVIKFYDISGGHQQMIATSDQFNDERGQKTIVSKIKLDKKAFGVNKELLMSIENKGKILAQTHFKILGEGEHFTGKVDFSEEEAAGKDKE